MATPTTSVIELLCGLRAVRRFDPAPVPQEVVGDLLEVARWTGSASNRQPWELIVIRERETLRALAALDGPPGPRHLAGAPLAIVLVMSGQATEFDEGRLAERIMLAAAAHGLGSSIAGFWGSQQVKAKAILQVTPERDVRMALSVGYPATARARLVSAERRVDTRQPLATIPVGRKPLAEFVHHERYGRHHDQATSRQGCHDRVRCPPNGPAPDHDAIGAQATRSPASR